MDVDAVAVAMFAECVEAEQSARRIGSDRDAAAVRERLRELAHQSDVRIRTGRVGETVVVVRLDASRLSGATGVPAPAAADNSH